MVRDRKLLFARASLVVLVLGMLWFPSAFVATEPEPWNSSGIGLLIFATAHVLAWLAIPSFLGSLALGLSALLLLGMLLLLT